MDNYTVYITYRLFTNNNTLSFKNESIHCNYINNLSFDNVSNKLINLKFPSVDEFKFLDDTGVSGYIANQMDIIVQIVSKYDVIRSNKWKVYNVTSQIESHIVGNAINKNNLVNTVFQINLNEYSSKPFYDLNYLDYPLSNETKLCFGDEEYFFGNVLTNIGATAYTTDIRITLPTTNYNVSTNKTWISGQDVYISEVGIYDTDKNLVAIGTFNKPVKKNNKTNRTLVFEIDF